MEHVRHGFVKETCPTRISRGKNSDTDICNGEKLRICKVATVSIVELYNSNIVSPAGLAAGDQGHRAGGHREVRVPGHHPPAPGHHGQPHSRR